MTKRSKQPKALAGSHSDEVTREPASAGSAGIAIGHNGYGIAELADELADLAALYMRMSEAGACAQREIDKSIKARTCGTERHESLCGAHGRFKFVEDAAYGTVTALRRLILGLEPRTPSETLSLALVFYDELDTFVSDLMSDDSDVRAEKRRLQRAMLAVIRGLVFSAKATSPLLKHYLHPNDLLPWETVRATATREANLYGITYDPVEGGLFKEQKP